MYTVADHMRARLPALPATTVIALLPPLVMEPSATPIATPVRVYGQHSGGINFWWQKTNRYTRARARVCLCVAWPMTHPKP